MASSESWTLLRQTPSTRGWSVPSACFPLTVAAARSLQSCPTLCDPIDGISPGSPIPGILQARTLEWVAIPFSNASKWKVKVKSLSHVQLFATPWTAAYQAPLSTGIFQAVLEWVAISFSRGSSWPRDQTCICCVSCLAGGFFSTEPHGKSRESPYKIKTNTLRAKKNIYNLPQGLSMYLFLRLENCII